jgi:hypothetical protein
MIENENTLVKLSKEQNLSYVIYVEEKSYSVHSISINKSQIPVRAPTTRGGVYFTDTTAYKLKVIMKDLSIKNEIPKLMLGPNTDFKPILVKTHLKNDDIEDQITMTTHLTNAVSTKEKVELNLLVDKVALG